MLDLINVSYDTQIPNNVGLQFRPSRAQGAGKMAPRLHDWWTRLIPEISSKPCLSATAVSVDPKGWAKFDYVKMPEYRWACCWSAGRGWRIPCGEHAGSPPARGAGEYGNMLKRLIVIQGEYRTGQLEQQRFLGLTAPSLYDMRNPCSRSMSRKAGPLAMV